MRQRSSLRRATLAVIAFVFSLVVLGALGVAVVLGLLAKGAIPVDVSAQIARALNERVGGGYAFEIGSTEIAETGHGPSLAIHAITVKDGAGQTILAAPRASVAVDPLALLSGRIAPKRLEIEDVELHLVRMEDGTIAMAGGGDQDADVRLSTLFSTLSTPPAAAAPGSGADAAVPPAPPNLPALLARGITAASDELFGAKGPLHAVDRLGLRNGRLIIDDQLRGTSTTYADVAVDVDRIDANDVDVTLGATGPAGPWSAAAHVERGPDGSRTVDLSADKLSYDELILGGEIRKIFFETDMPLSFKLRAEVGPDGHLRSAGGPVSFGAGYFKLDDPDHEPAMVDGIDGALTMDPATGALTIGKGVLTAGPTRFDFDLSATPPAGAADPWAIGGNATGTFGPERPGEQPIALDKISFASRFFPAARQFVLDTATAQGPEVAFKMNAVFQATDSGFWIKSGMDMGKMPGQAVIRLWPNWVASPVRAWLLRNLHGGSIDYGHGQLYLTDVDLDRMRHQHSVPTDHVHIDFGASNAVLGFMDGVPPLRGLDGTGLLTGDSFTFTASKAEMEVSPGHKLTASDGSMVVPSTDPKPTPATIGLRVTGAIDALADLLSRDALKSYADLPIDASTVSGSFDGRLTIGLKIGTHTPKDDTTIGVVATARDFTAAKVIGKEALQNATLTVTADRKGLHAKGDGRMFGAPATLDVSKPTGGGPSEASILLTLDEAARQKAGLFAGRSVTGPMTAKIATSLTSSDRQKASVTLDFTRCAFDAPIPGLRKAVGRPAKATFLVTQETNRTAIDQIAFDSGGSAIRGSAVLDANGALTTANLSQMRISPGDEAKVDITRAADGFKVVVHGTNIDARPFLKYVTGNESTGDGGGGTLDLEIHANLLTGQNAQAMSAVDLHLIKHATQLRKLQMSARLGHGMITANTVVPGQVALAAKDAGSMLSFLDLYNRMDGGELDSTLRFGDQQMEGTATIRHFTIREDPSIKKLAEEEVPSNARNSGARIDPTAVAFTKLEANFTRVGNKVEVRQGAMFGPQAGATVEGSIDFGHDRVALKGTFVPLYGLNNLVSHIPLLGTVLGGGAHEGLFTLDYRITGSASAPMLSINPLTVFAPGFTRKIFGAIDDATQPGLNDTNDTAAPAAPATAPVPPK